MKKRLIYIVLFVLPFGLHSQCEYDYFFPLQFGITKFEANKRLSQDKRFDNDILRNTMDYQTYTVAEELNGDTTFFNSASFEIDTLIVPDRFVNDIIFENDKLVKFSSTLDMKDVSYTEVEEKMQILNKYIQDYIEFCNDGNFFDSSRVTVTSNKTKEQIGEGYRYDLVDPEQEETQRILLMAMVEEDDLYDYYKIKLIFFNLNYSRLSAKWWE